jgi:hypothetical protein
MTSAMLDAPGQSTLTTFAKTQSRKRLSTRARKNMAVIRFACALMLRGLVAGWYTAPAGGVRYCGGRERSRYSNSNFTAHAAKNNANNDRIKKGARPHSRSDRVGPNVMLPLGRQAKNHRKEAMLQIAIKTTRTFQLSQSGAILERARLGIGSFSAIKSGC